MVVSSLYSSQYQRKRNRKAIIFLVLTLPIAALTGKLLMQWPAETIVWLCIGILLVSVTYKPIIGMYVALFTVIFCELFPNGDPISEYSSLPLSNIKSFTPIPISATPLEVLVSIPSPSA